MSTADAHEFKEFTWNGTEYGMKDGMREYSTFHTPREGSPKPQFTLHHALFNYPVKDRYFIIISCGLDILGGYCKGDAGTKKKLDTETEGTRLKLPSPPYNLDFTLKRLLLLPAFSNGTIWHPP